MSQPSVACPHCQNHLENSPELAGQAVSCPQCGGQFLMPPATPAPAPPRAKPAGARPAAPRQPNSVAPVVAAPATAATGAGTPLIHTDAAAPAAGRTGPHRRRRRSSVPAWGLAGMLVTPAIVILVIVLLVVGLKENAAAGKRLLGTWEVDLDELARQGQGTGVAAGFHSSENSGDDLRDAGIRIGLRFQEDGRVFLDSRVPGESEKAWGSWSVERSKKTSMRVSINWDDEFGREVLDIRFLSQDRFKAESSALFDRSTLTFQRLVR